MRTFLAARRLLFLGALVALSSWGGWASGVEPAKNGKAEKPVAKPKAAETTYDFNMGKKPWSQVLEWLANKLDVHFVGAVKPTGTLSFIAPKGKTKYTMPEIIDILNEALLEQSYLILRRPSSFTIVTADEKIPTNLVARIQLKDLDKFGKTEFVSLVLPLKALMAEDFKPEVKQMLGPFGEVVAFTAANQLLLTDTVASLKQIVKTIKDLEDESAQKSGELHHKCKWVKARYAAELLLKAMGDPKDLLPRPQQGRPPAAPAGKVRMYYITADEHTNSVLVTGPANKVAQAKSLLEKIDVQKKDQQPISVGDPFLKTYDVPGGNSDAVAKALLVKFKPSENLSITALGGGQIMIWGGPQDHIDIAKIISGGKSASNRKAESITLFRLEPAKALELLTGMFPESKSNTPYLGVDPNNNALIVRGSPEQITAVKDALKAIGEGGGSMRILTLEKGISGANLADALKQILPKMLKNPVKIIKPLDINEEKPEEPKKKEEEEKKEENKSSARKARQRPLTWQDLKADSDRMLVMAKKEIRLAQAKKKEDRVLFDPQKDKKDKKHGNSDSPLIIRSIGDRLMMESDDPEALAVVQEVIRFLTTAPSGAGDFAVIPLKNSSAVDVAKLLDQAYNGTQQQQPQNPFARFGRFGMPPEPPKEPRIRVVADPQTNSLLVRASPLDMLTIRHLLTRSLDSGKTASDAKTWPPIKLKNAVAENVADVIKDVYRQYIDLNAQQGGPGGLPGFFFRGFGNKNVDAQGNPRGVALSVGVDDSSNSIVLACSEKLYKDVKTLIENLDKQAVSTRKTIKIISIKGIDPTHLEQMLDALQGRRPRTPTTNPMGGGTGFPQGGGTFNPRGRNRSSLDPPPRGPLAGDERRGRDFFEHRVMDDPQPTIFFDPQQPDRARKPQLASNSPATKTAGPEVVITAVNDQDLEGRQTALRSGEPGTSEEQQPPPREDNRPAIPGFKGPVNTVSLPELGALIVSGENAADVEAAIKVILQLQKIAAGADVQIHVVPLDYADATSVAATLTAMFQRVIVNAASNTRAPITQQTAVQQAPGGQQVRTQQQQLASVTLLPLARFNAILLAAPQSRVDDIIREIKKLDRPPTSVGKAVSFRLEKASASRVANLLTQFYATRYPNDQHQIRITFDDSTNQVFVQAAPGDLEEIRRLIERMDNTVSNAINDLRIIHLNNAIADELAALLLRAISSGVVAPSATAGPVFPTAQPAQPAGGGFPGIPGGGGNLGGARPGGFGQGGGGGGGAPGFPPTTPVGGAPPTTPLGGATQAGAATKTTSLQFYSSRQDVPNIFRSGRLEDVHITPDGRTNSLIIAAPKDTMSLVLALVKELDVVPAARAEINIFTFKKADANAMANLLQQLFLGTGGLGAQRPATTPGVPGVPGGGVPFTGGGGGGATGGVRPLQLSLGGYTPEGAPLIELRITVDDRTNSMIVAGSRNDLDVIEAMVSRLEDSNVQQRRNEVYKLRNAVAADVAAALNDFLPRSLQVDRSSGVLTPFQEFQREVIVSFEPVSNTLIISATPRYHDEVMRLVSQLDIQPPQVVIQVLLAEVDLTGSEEFGVEIGLQSPVLFNRSILPSPTLFGGAGSTTIANAAGGLVSPGVTVNSAIQPTAFPGFNFNTTNPLGNNPVEGPGIVGFQGLGNLGVGRVSPTSGVGGFVFSAASNTFNLLIRALKTQGRMDVLSRPQVMALDNQTAFVQVGSRQPYVSNTTISALGNVINTVAYQNVGVILNVTPKINPDGTILMRVDPQVSSVVPSQVNLGNGVLATAFNIQEVQTTVVAGDGETVAIGGLISTKDQKAENKVPWLGDLPLVGAAFRYRTQQKAKTELLVILTPHIVKSRADADRILAEEGRRMDWCLGDVIKTQGTSGMEPLFPPPRIGPGVGPGSAVFPPAVVVPTVPAGTQGSPAGREQLPPPTPLPSSNQSMAPATRPAMAPVSAGVPVHYDVPIPPENVNPSPAAGQRKESR